MKSKYDAIVFDLGNTVIRFDHNISAGKIAKLFNLEQKRIYDAFFDSEMTRAFEKGLVSPREFHARAADYLGIKIPYDDFVSIWSDIFWEDEEVSAIVRRLKQDYKVFLLSNINRLHFEHIERKFDIIKVFDELILSFVIGAMKPEPAIFEDTVRRAGGDRTKILYIDDRADLIKEAAAMGIDSIRFEGAENLKIALSDKGLL